MASFDDVLGGQEDDETFLYNPVNVYNMIRHVAVGWAVVEESLTHEKKMKKGQLPKRVRRVLARKKRSHIPGAEDLDGIAVGIVRLHDYYKFNTTRYVRMIFFKSSYIVRPMPNCSKKSRTHGLTSRAFYYF